MAPLPGMGWIPDLPSIHDYTTEHEFIKPLVKNFGLDDLKKKIPAKVDLQKWFSPVVSQGKVNSCTAFAATALVEYYEKKAFGKYIETSPMFVYKVTKNLLKINGNVGAYPRAAMGALTLFGVPPEEYWPYNAANIDEEPTAFCYSFAENYKAIYYYRLDTPEVKNKLLLDLIKLFLAHQLPIMVGFTVYSVLLDRSLFKTATIPFPDKTDTVKGGHAVALAGYDDTKKVTHPGDTGDTTTGAFLIKNSWGEDWGPNKGFGWLPYKYVTAGLVRDCWALFQSKWIDTGQFGIQ